MKKLQKLSLKQLEDEMPVMTEKMLTGIMGGYDPNDCMWRCFAYINGGAYGSVDAESLACNYYGSSFDSTNYGFSGTGYEADDLGCNVLGSTWNDPSREKILVFNPNHCTGWQGNGNSSHAVIFQGTSADGTKYLVYDPQSGQYGEVLVSDLNSSSSPNYLL